VKLAGDGLDSGALGNENYGIRGQRAGTVEPVDGEKGDQPANHNQDRNGESSQA
jgi:hypothetical protein